MDLFKNIILLFVGAAVFLLGMNMMSSGLRKATGGRIKKLFSKVKDNKLASLGIGAATTALIQSSAATSIMAIGFLSVGVMTIYQTLSVMMGAYIGTTVTGLIVSISSLGGVETFDITLVFMLLTFVGVVLSFFKNNIVKHIGEILAGLGLLFFGLFTLKDAFSSTQINKFSQNVFSAIENPFLLVVLGALFTMLVQSSSASTGIMIVMCGTGAVTVSSAVYVALGATVGTVVTTIIASITGSSKGKRVAVIALIIRVVMALLFLAILWPLDAVFSIFDKLSSLFVTKGLFIAVFMVVYNVITMLILLPFVNKIVDLSTKLFKDKEQTELESYVKFIDVKMLNNPEIALMQVEKEIANMSRLAFENYKRGYNAILNDDLSEKELIIKTENGIDYLNNRITDFLIELSSKVEYKESRKIGGYFHVINDIERVGDHAENFLDNSIKMHDLNLKFSSVAKKEINELNEVIEKMFEKTFESFNNPSEELVKEIHTLEDKTDDLKDEISTAHYNRITKGTCTIELSPFLCTLVSELERIGDHLTNVGYIHISPTGDEEQK